MNGAKPRDLMAQVVIILAVCVGGWMMMVEPKLVEQHELEAAIQEARQNPALNQTTIEMMAKRLDEVRIRAADIRRQNRFAEDSSRFYARVSALAETHDVHLRSLNPGARTSGREAEGEKAVHAVSFNIVAEGGYEALAAFISAIESVEGFVRPVSIALTPTQRDGRNTVEARVQCEAMHFTIPEALAALAGADHDQR